MPVFRRIIWLTFLLVTALGFSAGDLTSAFAQAAASPSRPNGAVLLVYERAECSWCALWDSEIASVYPKTDIGKQVPFRRINLDQPRNDDPRLADPVRFTPTFVLMRDGQETGRITGYHNDGFFWGLLEAIVQQKTPPSINGKKF